MAEFRFFDNRVSLVIAGQKFFVEPFKVQKKAALMQKKMSEFVENIGEMSSEQKQVEAACDGVCQCIDMMLGRGAAKRIFRNRSVTFFDCCDVYFFVQQQVMRFVEGKLKRYYSASAGEGRKK